LMFQISNLTPIVGFGPEDEQLSFLPLCHIAERSFSVFLPLYAGPVVNFVEGLDTVPENCIVSPQELDKKGGTTVLKFDNQARFEDRVRANKLLFDSRQYGMRLSPHIYTNKSDIDCLIDCIKQHLT